MSFYLYKGLKKPLVFFGLKDKYIYYAVGCIVGGLVLTVIIKSFLGLFGLILGVAITSGSVWWIYKTQDTKGLYSKTKNAGEIHIFPKRYKFHKNK